MKKLNSLVFIFFQFLIFTCSGFGQELKLTMIYIGFGAGDSMLVETPGGKRFLVDGGMPDCGDKFVVPFLKKKNITRLDGIVLTHKHMDHYGGLAAVVRACEVGEFIDSASDIAKDDKDKNYAKLRALLEEKKVPLKKPAIGDVYDWGGACVKVLNTWAPDLHKNEGPNINSIVLKITYKNVSYLLTGDMDTPEFFVKNGSDIKSDVLKLPHHGLSDAFSFDFSRAVLPRVAVVAPGNIEPLTLEAYRLLGTEVYRTDLDGDITITSDGERLTAKAEKITTESKFSPRRLKHGVTMEGKEGVYIKKARSGWVGRTVRYKDGQLDGEDVQYQSKDKLGAKLYWKAGELDGVCEYYGPKLKILARIGFKNGKREGLAQFYNDDGELLAESNAREDRVEWSKLYDHGKVSKEIIFESGMAAQIRTYGEKSEVLSTEHLQPILK